ncbi:hypothetical protein MMC24_007219 [Lignoscripta atroalba]|nr:hypothetical protein [Lignoscripta atroalba]
MTSAMRKAPGPLKCLEAPTSLSKPLATSGRELLQETLDLVIEMFIGDDNPSEEARDVLNRLLKLRLKETFATDERPFVDCLARMTGSPCESAQLGARIWLGKMQLTI